MDYKKTFPLIVCLLIAGGIVVFKYSSRTSQETASTLNTILIQGSLNAPQLAEIKQAIAPKIDAIIKEEAGIDNAFKLKEAQLLTIYYAEDIVDDANVAVVMQEATHLIENHQPALMLQNTHLTFDVRFFGDEFDELVIMADDHAGELASANTLFKNALHVLNESNRVHYNVEKSERYAYHPHVSLGKINLPALKKSLGDSSATIDAIRTHIIDETLRTVKTVTNNQPIPITFESIRIFDTNAHSATKDVVLK